MKLYIRTPHTGNEYKVCNEKTDEVIAIFFNQKDAVNYTKMMAVLTSMVGDIEYNGEASKESLKKANEIINA